MVGSEVEKFKYDGRGKPKNFNLNRLKNALKIKELDLRYNKIETIEKLNHLKELKELDLRYNKI